MSIVKYPNCRQDKLDFIKTVKSVNNPELQKKLVSSVRRHLEHAQV